MHITILGIVAQPAPLANKTLARWKNCLVFSLSICQGKPINEWHLSHFKASLNCNTDQNIVNICVCLGIFLITEKM